MSIAGLLLLKNTGRSGRVRRGDALSLRRQSGECNKTKGSALYRSYET